MASGRKDTKEGASERSLEERIERQRGKPLPLEASSSDIGGELLSILSKGLYTNPLDCLREYAQNGVDAGARKISIKITGDSVAIIDDGEGMDLNDIRQARRVGLSPKSIREHVGFRGIGLYSGFDLCRELSIISTKRGDDATYQLVLKFADMKEQLDKERSQAAGAQRTSLIDLLSQHTKIAQLNSTSNKHGTSVTLQDVSPEHVARLSDRLSVKNYLLQNLPIDFSEDFPFADELRARLKENVPDYRAVHVTLQLPGQPKENVEKYSSEGREDGWNLSLPECHPIGGSSKSGPIAYYWASLNPTRKSVDARASLAGQYAGIIYKKKGFSIGTREKVRHVFEPRAQVYPWFTGEIYVLDPNVIPNAERNDFETSPAKLALLSHLKSEMAQHLIRLAEKRSKEGKAEEKIEGYGEQLDKLERTLKTSHPEEESLRFLGDILALLKDLEKRRKQLPSSSAMVSKAKEYETRAKRLQATLQRELASPDEELKRRRAKTKHGEGSRPDDGQRPAVNEPVPTLYDLLVESGWEITDDIVLLTEIIQEAAEGAMSSESRDYRQFFELIAERLTGQDDD